ncbi:BON domain-containing protein [Nitratireductor sp. CAU 1489]|uniref:BON domain-containing protein n=1 Tax=Nitratireductor arenosus TaxID=2682096 RepID=A0A844QG87_9HYPH|nr:type II and III secretion system protein family protein [Nitratireductor arenosus]MVA98976.1 BON domain-containing protein [Nitratireductor arenosus]
MKSATQDRFARRGRVAALLAACVLALASLAFADHARANGGGKVIQISAARPATIKVARGKPQTIRTDTAFYEIVIGDPEIANVNPLTDRSFYVLGNKLGTTGIALFDDARQLVGTVDIEVTLDTNRLATTIRQAVPDADIRVESANGRLVLSGSAKDAVAADKAQRIASRFSDGEEIINSVDISSSQQVQLNVRFVEINRQVGQELGAALGVSYVGAGGGVSFNSDPRSSSNTPAGKIVGALVSGGLSIDLAIRALEDKGVARRLAEPNLIARSGERASFLAGGEFPIPVAQDDDKVVIEYKKYGVGLDFTPQVLADGLVSLEIEPEVSSIDTSASYKIGDIAIPGFIVRRAHTSVDLKSGQSFMIAGLLQTQNDVTTQNVPGLSRLPVLGNLFSSKAYQRRETDLVIIITPYLVRPIDPSKNPLTPIDRTKPASTVDYFLGSQEEARIAQTAARIGAVRTALSGPGHFLELSE